MNSLNRRLLWVSLFVLVAFLGAAGLALEQAFSQSLQQARQDRLQAHLYALLAASELEAGQLTVSARHPDERLFTPGSGLYAQILDADGAVVWRSRSLFGVDVAFGQTQAPGENRFFEPRAEPPLFAYAYGVAWQDPDSPEQAFTVIIAVEQRAFRDQLQVFRANLWSVLGGVTLVLLLALAAVVRWGLAPLRAVERDIADIEAGRIELLQGQYPKELQGLTDNLNKLIRNERKRMQHYRNTLANLAHSLKTPLAVLRNGLASERDPEMAEQVERMNTLVEYQLQRAAATGQATFSAPLELCPLVEKLLTSLDKVYRGKSVSATLDCEPGLRVRVGEGDLMELFGNLLDNAYKWCTRAVAVRLSDQVDCIQIEISDDGPGIPEAEAERVQKRGERNDTRVSGQGIGLAVVADILNVYGGELTVGRSEFGGTRILVELPAR